MAMTARWEIFPDDLDATADFYVRVLAHDWPLAEDVTDRPWGLPDFRILDPSGYYLRITTRE